MEPHPTLAPAERALAPVYVVTVSILLGTYNRLTQLKACLAAARLSVGRFTYEFVVVDGGSTDGTRAWLAEQPDVILVGKRSLDGAVDAFNLGFRFCRGEFICNLNDDCLPVGAAIADGVTYLRTYADVGQVAFALRAPGEEWHVCRVFDEHSDTPTERPTEYANFGIIRHGLAEEIAYITDGFWAAVYHTYAGDTEMSAWVWRLGYRVAPLYDARVENLCTNDELRALNSNSGRPSIDARKFYARWSVDAFLPDGPLPKVSETELSRYNEIRERARFRRSAPIEDTRALGDRLYLLDPVDGAFPPQAAPAPERILHAHLCTSNEPQNSLVAALSTLGAYARIDWLGVSPAELHRRLLAEARRIRPTLVFLQLQALGVVAPETIRELRTIITDPRLVVATWCGDVASVNSPWGLDAFLPLHHACDLALHSSLFHVRKMRSLGLHNAAYLQIGYCEDRYKLPAESIERVYDVSFLGSRYYSDSYAASVKRHDGALRDAAVTAFQKELGARFGLFGHSHGEGVREIAPAKSNRVYWSSAMALSVSLCNDYDLYTSDRLLRILACGTVALVKRFPGMSTYGLKHGENCLIWETVDEAVALARAWIEREDDLARVGLAGARLAREHHTWGVRMRELVPYLRAVRGDR